MQDLGTFGGEESFAYGINDSGQVVGNADSSSNENAFLYSGGTMQSLTTPADFSYATGINNSGQIVGGASNSSGNVFAFFYSGGTMQILGALPDYTYGSNATGINDSGQIVGWAYAGAGDFARAFLYSNGTMQDLGTFGHYTYGSTATGINDSGQIVGWAYDNTGARAFLFNDGSMQDLNSMLLPNTGWTLTEANAINDKGQICGQGINPSGQTDAFLLTPTPEPSTVALLGAGAVGLLGYAWRRRKQKRSLSIAGESGDVETDLQEGPAILSMPSHWAESQSARRAA
jgi:probable HAF family extracellular repeat protein